MSNILSEKFSISSQNPIISMKCSGDEEKKKLKFVIIDQDKEIYDGTYSDSGQESETEQGFDDEEDEDAISEDGSYSSKKYAGSIKGKKANPTKNQKQSLPKRKPYQLVMNVSDTQYPVVKFVGKKLFKWKLCYDTENSECDLKWTDNAVQPETLGKMQPHQKINHFPGMFSLARKNHLARNLKKMKKEFPDQYKFFPQTWLLPAEYNELRNEFEKTQKGKCKTFIVKPEASCQGRGIFLTRNLDDLNSTDHYVVQRYLHKPYLIDGLKFDFRIYVLLAGCDPMRIYVFKEGLARLATEEYEPPHRENLDNLCMHLTNYAINKDNPNFEFNEDENAMDVGHKRSMTSVLELLQDQGHDVEKLWGQIKDILIKTIISAQPTLSHHYKSCQPDNYMNNMCFEILGFDVMLDSRLRPWLLEINHTPSFTTDTPLDSLIKKNCIRDAILLMNINNRTRNEIIQTRKEQLQKRVLTGKKVKLTAEEKQAEIKRCQMKREQYESKNLGNFEKVYPLEPEIEDIFVQMQQHSQLLYENWTGANIRRVPKKEQSQVVGNNSKGIDQSSKTTVTSANTRSQISQKAASTSQSTHKNGIKQEIPSQQIEKQTKMSSIQNKNICFLQNPNTLPQTLASSQIKQRMSFSLQGEDGQQSTRTIKTPDQQLVSLNIPSSAGTYDTRLKKNDHQIVENILVNQIPIHNKTNTSPFEVRRSQQNYNPMGKLYQQPIQLSSALSAQPQANIMNVDRGQNEWRIPSQSVDINLKAKKNNQNTNIFSRKSENFLNYQQSDQEQVIQQFQFNQQFNKTNNNQQNINQYPHQVQLLGSNIKQGKIPINPQNHIQQQLIQYQHLQNSLTGQIRVNQNGENIVSTKQAQKHIQQTSFSPFQVANKQLIFQKKFIEQRFVCSTKGL